MWNVKEMDHDMLGMIAENFRVAKLTGKILLYLRERKPCPDSWNQIFSEGIPKGLDIDAGDWEEVKDIVEDLRERELILGDILTPEEVYEDDFEDASSTSSLSHRSTSTTSSMEYGVLRVPTAFFPDVTPNKTCLKTTDQASTMAKDSTIKSTTDQASTMAIDSTINFTMVNTKEFYVSKREKSMKSKACPPEQAVKNREEYYGPSIDLSNTDDLDRLVANNLKFKRVKPENRIHDNDEIKSSNFAHIIKDVDKTARISKRADAHDCQAKATNDTTALVDKGLVEQMSDAIPERGDSASSNKSASSEDCVPLMSNEEILEGLEKVGRKNTLPQHKSLSADSFPSSHDSRVRVTGKSLRQNVESEPALAEKPFASNFPRSCDPRVRALNRPLYRPVKSSHALIQSTERPNKFSRRHVARSTIGQCCTHGRAVNNMDAGLPDVDVPSFRQVPQTPDNSHHIPVGNKPILNCRTILVQPAPGSEMDLPDEDPGNDTDGKEGLKGETDNGPVNARTGHESNRLSNTARSIKGQNDSSESSPSTSSNIVPITAGRLQRTKAFVRRGFSRIKAAFRSCNCLK